MSSTREGLDAVEREASDNDLERFFLELAPRLETARVLDRELDRQLARRFNVLDYLRTDELGLSGVVADLLNPEGNHGQGAVFLQLLLDKVGFKVDGKISGSRVDVELTIEDQSRLDIAVRIDERHCLAIENKPYAGDQHGQVEKYLKWLKQYDKHMLIYLSRTGGGPAEHSIGKADLAKLREHDDPRRFAIMPYHSAADLDDGFNDFRLPFSLADWLSDCRKSCDVDRLRWFLREAETFCQRQFGGNAMTDTESSVIEKFVLDDGRNVETAIAVHESWPDIKKKICRDFLKTVRGNLSKKMESLWPEVKISEPAYSEERYGWFIRAHFDCWEEYSRNKGRTSISLTTQHEKGPNDWSICVGSPLPFKDMELERDRSRRKQLETGLGDALKDHRGNKVTDYCPWWMWVDDKYRRWDSLIPDIYRESQEGKGGEIMRYFVEEFVKIAKAAIPVIDRIEGGKS